MPQDDQIPMLQRMEALLRSEARRFMNQALEPGGPECTHRLIYRLTGIETGNVQGIRTAREELLRQLDSEKRKSRRFRAGYDLNRHISLSRALDGLSRLETS